MPVQHFQDGSDQAAVTPAAGPSLSAADQVVYDAFLAERSAGGNRTQDILAGLSDEGLSLLTSTPKPPGFLQSAKDFTGQAVETIASVPGAVADWMTQVNVDYPELPVGAAPANATPAQKAKYIGLLTTTIDDYKLEEGVKNIFPGAMTSYDSQGNLLVSIENKDAEGNSLGVSTFYPNPRGLDRSTLLQLAGAITAVPAVEAGLATTFGRGAVRGYRGAALTAGTETAAFELGSKSITGLPYDWSAPASGAVFGPAFLGMGRLFGRASSYLINKYKNNPAAILNDDGTFTAQARDYIEGQGLNPDDIQASLFIEYKNLVDQGYIPEEAVIKAQAAGLPIEVKLTTGQVTRDMGQMLYEDMIAKGATETQASAALRQFYDAQVAAVKANVDEIAGSMGAGTRRQGAAEAQQVLRAQRDQAREVAGAKYDTARAAQQSFLDPSSARGFANSLDTTLEAFSPITTPKAWKLVDELKEGLRNGMDVAQIHIKRQQLTSAGRELGPEGEAARVAKDALDDYLDEVVSSNLFLQEDMFGNPMDTEAIRLWKDAINTWSGFKTRWETKGILKALTDKEMIDGELQFKVAPEDAANYIFGNSFLGLQSKRSIARDVRALKEQLAPDDWLALRGEVVVKLLDGSLTNASEEAARGVSGKLSTDWAIVRNNNKGLIDELFTKEEQGIISSLANVTGRIANRTQNRSNSGAAIGNLLGRLFTSLGGTVPVQAIAPVIGMALGPSVRSARSAGARRGRMTTPIPSRLIIGGASSVAGDPEAKEVLEEVVEDIPLAGDFIAPLVAPNAPPPQASVPRPIPAAPPTRGVPGLNEPASGAPATPVEAPPAAVAQGPSSREMFQQLFPFG